MERIGHFQKQEYVRKRSRVKKGFETRFTYRFKLFITESHFQLQVKEGGSTGLILPKRTDHIALGILIIITYKGEEM